MKKFPFILTCLFLSLGPAQEAKLAVGSPAPDFSLPYATRDSVAKAPLRLSEIIGARNIVLAFYPADWSTGCTKEVCTLRDSFSGLQAFNADVLGISGDYVWSHHAWAKHHDLPFRLLSDHRHEVARAYESFNEQTNFTRRTIFVVNAKGEIAYTDMDYSLADTSDFERLKKALASLR
ncbi:MAG: redoxin domain-containing protein [Bacteroidota bacterium]